MRRHFSSCWASARFFLGVWLPCWAYHAPVGVFRRDAAVLGNRRARIRGDLAKARRESSHSTTGFAGAAAPLHGKNRIAESVGTDFLYLTILSFVACATRCWRQAFAHLGGCRRLLRLSLVHLDTLLSRRQIPYRPSFSALRHLEERRLLFYARRSERQPTPPNYLLHESATRWLPELFGRPRDGRCVVGAERARQVMLGESFAMTAEYFARARSGGASCWFFRSAPTAPYAEKESRRAAARGHASIRGREFLLAFLYNNSDRPTDRSRLRAR